MSIKQSIHFRLDWCTVKRFGFAQRCDHFLGARFFHDNGEGAEVEQCILGKLLTRSVQNNLFVVGNLTHLAQIMI